MKCAGARAGIGLLGAAALIAAPLSTQAQSKGHSDKAVSVLMNFTWATMPQQFRHPSGEVIIVDKTKKLEVMVPLEKSREVIGVADRSARAQYCGLIEEQEANYHTMMRRERTSNQWTSQQILFINLLHMTTVAYLTGTAKFQFGEDGQQDVEIVTKGPVWTEPCTDDVRGKIKAGIMAYINEAPAIPAAKATQPAMRAEPASGTQTK